MEKEPLINFIQKNFQSPIQIVTDIVSHFESKQLAKNEFLLKAGSVSDEYFFLEEGFLRAFTHDSDGEEVTTNFFFEQKMIFEVSSFFLRVKSMENIQAITDTKGYVITFEQLNHLFHTVPAFREFGRIMLVKEFTQFKFRTLERINQNAEQRYITLIKNYPEIFQHAQLKHIASYLGMTDSSLSRIRREFSKKIKK